MTKGNVGALLDRLESMGWVMRKADPNDRRANRLYLTPGGRETILEIIKKHRAFIAESLRAAFGRAVRDVAVIAQNDRARLGRSSC